MKTTDKGNVWIIQRCIDAWTNHYENWQGYCEKLMSREEMMVALKECDEKWPEFEFRGHNTTHESVRHKRGEYPRPNNNPVDPL